MTTSEAARVLNAARKAKPARDWREHCAAILASVTPAKVEDDGFVTLFPEVAR